MAYNIRNVIDVANKLQGMPPDRKTFGYGLAVAKGTPEVGHPIVRGPYTSAAGVAEDFGSNSEVVKIADTYFKGGWFGTPYQFFVSLINTETLASLKEWTVGQAYAVDNKVQNGGAGYVCTQEHVSSGTFSVNLWEKVETPESPEPINE